MAPVSTDPPAPRTRLSPEQRRSQLLDLGVRLLATRSVDELSIDLLAEEAGISRGLLYHYFGSKRAYYVATVAHAAQRLLDETNADPSLPSQEQLRAGFAAYLDFVERRADAYAALIGGGLGADAEVHAIVENTRQVIIDRMLAGVGLTAPPPVVVVALRAWVGAVEAACLEWLHHRAVTRDALFAVLVGGLTGLTHAAAELAPGLEVPVFAGS